MKKEVCQGLKRNHRTICKFGVEDSAYADVLRRFNAIAVEIQRQIPAQFPVPPTGEIIESETARADTEEGLRDRLKQLKN